VKSTPMRGVKENLKPDAYKQSELQMTGLRKRVSEGCVALGSCFLKSVIWGDGVPLV
jgi:hypothetical protein